MAILTIILVIIGLSLLILGHEAGHFLLARIFGLKVDEFGFGFPPRITARKKGETEYSINWLPFGGFVKIAGEEEIASGGLEELESLPLEEKRRYFFFQPIWKRFSVIASGVLVNFLIGWLLISFIFMVGTPPLLVVSSVQKNSPAEKAGIMTGDVIKNFILARDFIDFVNQRRGQLTAIEIRRGSQELSFKVTPRLNTGPTEGPLGVFLAEAGVSPRGVFSALQEGLKQSFFIAGMTAVAFYKLLKNLFLHGSLLEGVVGPLGIFAVATETGRVGTLYLLQLIGVISLNLAVINLIPFPALDGGRLFLLLVEKIKGSPISLKFQMWVNRFGFILLILLMVLITIRDISQWF